MALSAAQRAQLCLLPIADSSLDAGDRYALSGVVWPETTFYAITAAQRAQLCLLPIADSSLSEGDRYALAGVVQSLNTGGDLTDVFDVTWQIDPAWTATKAPATVDGGIGVALQSASLSLLGAVTDVGPTVNADRVIAVAVDDDTITVALEVRETAAVDAENSLIEVDAESDEIEVADDRDTIQVNNDDTVEVV